MFQQVKNYLWHLPKSYLFAALNAFPCRHLTLIAVTGTDGKTTTCNLIYEVLRRSGLKVGVLSTIGAKIQDRLLPIPPHMTSPDPSLVQKIFKEMLDENVTHVVVEVTAHALDQFRFSGCRFKIAGITNITHEHLDYFHNMNTYIKVKSQLFKLCDIAVLNRDDESFNTLITNTPAKIVTYSQKQKSDYTAKNIKITADQLSFDVNKVHLSTDSNYDYQVNNILLAFAICQQLSIDPAVFAKTIISFPEMKGRRELVANDLGITTIIDFAHTPAALETTLSSLKKNCRGRLIAIFGATGGRDQSKRPLMGKVVSRLADIGIVTADDTRNEQIADINEQIISGFDESQLSSQKFTYYNIPHRQDAFNLAISLAKSGDTVVACGKGHETTILHGTTEYPWSERAAFMTAFKLREVKNT
ncbi:UDP-N-acetylmuramoyl-L-alanyl-D-glutamate--2,6-diaminopimelate ligase [Patescibacteria group bacterium]|nr:UDP-N-acetylmuramoyl-L-alanyl-D-glutamate--2,6-diaminopimelate ligase [Patescibacteria group bacterium]